jgi:hypothetical protein
MPDKTQTQNGFSDGLYKGFGAGAFLVGTLMFIQGVRLGIAFSEPHDIRQIEINNQRGYEITTRNFGINFTSYYLYDKRGDLKERSEREIEILKKK